MNAIINTLNAKFQSNGKILEILDEGFGIDKCTFVWVSYDSNAEKGNKQKVRIQGYVDMDEILQWRLDMITGAFRRKYDNSKKDGDYYKPIYEVNGGSIGINNTVRARKIEVVKNTYKQGVIFKVTEGPGKTTTTGGIVFDKQEGIANQTAFFEFKPFILDKILLYYQSYITSCYLNVNEFPNIKFNQILINSKLEKEELDEEMRIIRNFQYDGDNSVLLRYFFGRNQHKVEKNLNIIYNNDVKKIINNIRSRGDKVSCLKAS